MRRFLAIASLLWLAAAPLARAANIVVETTADGVTGPLCDIRDALRSAEDDVPSGGCAESDPNGADVVDLTGLTGSIDLTNGVLLTIHSDVTVVGPGAGVLTIDGLGTTPIWVVGDHGTLTIEGLTIASGSTAGRGGCIAVTPGGTLFLRDSRVTGCAGDNGGAIAVDGGGARLDRVLVDANTASNSGAGLINGAGVVAINDSTFSGNVATQAGGGVATFGADGGGTVTWTRIHSSTFADNGADVGENLYDAVDPDPLVDTILTHVLVANPRGGEANCAGAEAFTSEGWNLATDASCGLAGVGDKPSTAAGIAALADNGGPTATHALELGSAAIDGGNPLGCVDSVGVAYAFDQRGPGFPRRTNGNGIGATECDIGAYEKAPEPVATALGAAAVASLAGLARRRARR